MDDILRIVDQVTAEFIQQGFEAIIGNWAASGLLASILSLYILYFLYQVQFYNAPLSDATLHLMKVCFVFMLSTNWPIFYLLIYNLATNEPLHILNVLLSGKGALIKQSALNDTFITGMKQAMGLMANMPHSIKGVVCAFVAAAVLILATFLFTLVALGIIVISKFYLSVYLAIAPYFLILFLFNGTKGLSESWVRSCLNYALVPVFVGCVLSLTTVLATSCFNLNELEHGKAPDFLGIILFFASSLISAYLIKVAPEKAAALTSSLAMASASRIAQHTKQLTSPVQQASTAMHHGLHSSKHAFVERQQRLQDEVRQRAEANRLKQEEVRARRARAGY